jgi:reductive dehalogenase
VDERTIMFARARLEPGSPKYNTYYQNHPEHLEHDSAFRQNPGLLEPGASFYDPLLASSPEGGFFLTEALREAVDGPISPQKTERTPEQFTQFMKSLAKYHGAVDVGICELHPYHIYSHIGRGSGAYGAPIALDHQFAIAFTVEMTHEMIIAAPKMPALMESARQYAEAGKIAVIMAAAIRHLGYPARAHIDGNYRVIAPLVAKDAGLGEIGRMGLLMTPKLGPRVRLGVVTTSLPLISDQPTWEPSVIDFCENCHKCADVCPADALPFGTRQTYADGTLRWKINPERCYTYWTKIGTDCGRCMAACPYSHADNFLHNLIRWGVQRSGNFRRAAVALDDLFYGKKPLPHPAPDWVLDSQNKTS